jgi:hypothetical protein
MPFPNLHTTGQGENKKLYIQFSATNRVVFHGVIGYDGDRDDEYILFWGNKPDEFVDLSNINDSGQIDASFGRSYIRFGLHRKITVDSLLQFAEQNGIEQMSQQQWRARFQQPAPQQEPEEQDPQLNAMDEDPVGGRKTKRRKTHRKGK